MKTPIAPRHLSAAARNEWKALAPIAVQAGTLTPDTMRSFEFLVSILATEREASAIVTAEGVVVKSAAGTSKPHPAVRSLETARTQAAPLLRKFRLLPGSASAPSKANREHRPAKRSSIWKGVLQQ